MKRFLVALLLVSLPFTAFAAPLGRASAEFDNAHPDKSETAWGRLVSDALRSSANADLAVVNAGVLRKGALHSGAIGAADVEALLAYPDDDVVVLRISGAQLRAALERAVQAYPTGSPAMLELSGFSAAFNAQSPINRRVTMVRVHGQEVKDSDMFAVAMPVSLAEGGAGYYTIWNARGATHLGNSLGAVVSAYIHSSGTVAPDGTARLAPQ